VEIMSVIDHGMDGLLVTIECHISNGLPAIVIIGYASKAVDEAKERLRSAFASSSLDLPRKRIIINLAPGDLPKDGTGLDLAIAVAVLTVTGQVKTTYLRHSLFLGELGLDGSLRPIRGIIGKLLTARQAQMTKVYLPTGNFNQAQLVPGITVIPVANLRQLYLHLTDTEPIPLPSPTRFSFAPAANADDLADIVGHPQAKRGLEIAAAGGHNILLTGPPGTGKSLLAKAFPSILPPLSREEMLEVTHLHSLAGDNYKAIVTNRPFRAPHHSASSIAITGGGQKPRPGEISLAHRGVLFLDELPEFQRATIEALRQPLEERLIRVSRAQGSVNFPAHFILLATANPCPCGYAGSPKPCECLPSQVMSYQRKLSGPIMDRIDMTVPVSDIDYAHLLDAGEPAEASALVARRVQEARQWQAKRFQSAGRLNADMSNRQLRQSAQLSPSAEDLLTKAAERLQLSARNYMRAIKVARTIADLAQSTGIEPAHMAEALQFRLNNVASSTVSS
jgi:magnesium chelatase family protein